MSIVIRAEKLAKMYHIGKKHSGSLRETITSRLHNILTKKEGDPTEFWALKDISFEVKQGEVMGIIGKNGAGKSTLLKILSRITDPTEGSVVMNGRVSCLLEVGTGFHPELTGRENIFMNGAILGMRRAEITRKFDEIVAFSGIEQFIDTPVKRYSSGMYVRLAFAVAAHLEPEILIVDEVLAVGDTEFQKKCLGKMRDVSEHDGRTVLFVSHNMSAMAELCNSSLLLVNGQLTLKGPTKQVIESYLGDFTTHYNKHDLNKDTLIRQCIVLGADNKPASTFQFSDPIRFQIDYFSKKEIPDAWLCLAIRDKSGGKIFSSVYKLEKIASGDQAAMVEIPPKTLITGNYTADIALFDAKNQYDYLLSILGFVLVDTESNLATFNDPSIGSMYVDCKWSLM
jgi:lipopolysaccharide transport system ATP-binding protein